MAMYVIKKLASIMSIFEEKMKDQYVFGLWGVIMHLAILWGVLDANFHSPVVKNLNPVPPGDAPPAKRLFLFVADGLRYRTFSESPPHFLGNVMRDKGVWGISHTRVPTESRPGNVAIAAGLYEDPSALFKGWKENPVDFDSVFNRSTTTWAWGSPDIIPMFVKGSSGNVNGVTYPHEWQNFDPKLNSPRRLDQWVFNEYDKWLETYVESTRSQSGVILFFHLLGCDTVGHARKPMSSEYESQMTFVDEGIAEVMRKAEIHFKDEATSYIFTADHGMTDWGSHGGGSEDETETPFVAWGAGIAKSNSMRHINQADIAPLISTLLGISIPTNSEGLLPRFFLKQSDEKFGLRSVLNNIKQLIIQTKATRIIATGDKPSISQIGEKKLEASVDEIENLLRANKITEGLRQADSVIQQTKEALYYYRRFQRMQLICYLSLLWIGWIVLLIHKLFGTHRGVTIVVSNGISCTACINAGFSIVMIFLIIEHQVSARGDWRVLSYGIISFFSMLLALRKASTHYLQLKASENFPLRVVIGYMILLIITLSAGMIDKRFFSAAMIITSWTQKRLIRNPHRFLIPTAGFLAIYPMFPALKPHTNIIMIFAPFVITPFFLPKLSRNQLVLELIRMCLTGLIVTEVLDGRSGLSWLILISTPISILLYPTEPRELKLTGVIFGLLCPLILLSASYEPQVFCLLGIHLVALLETMKKEEKTLHIHHSKRNLDIRNVVIAVYFMLYILLSFYGTGNVASISSFDPMWTRHFVTIFSPYTMTILILLKLAIPLILVGCASRVLVSSSIFMVVLLLGDCLSLPLMYSVSSHGSWLEIGTAISRYSISVTLPCLFFVLYYISSPLMLFNIGKAFVKGIRKSHLI